MQPSRGVLAVRAGARRRAGERTSRVAGAVDVRRCAEPTRRRRRARSAATRALVAGNAMADALPLFEALGASACALPLDLAAGAAADAARCGSSHRRCAAGVNAARRRHDVVIMGGGLAGLTLALQLRQRFAGARHPGARAHARTRCPRRRTRSASRRSRSARTTSTRVLGLKEHLNAQQLQEVRLPLLLLRRAGSDIDQVTELGASRYLSTPSYQLDRGIFENFLGEHARALGMRFVDGAVVRSFDLGARRRGCTGVRFANERRRAARSRDAAGSSMPRGRAGLLKRKLGSGRGQRARRERRLVPHRAPHRHRRVVDGRGLARALRAADALAVDQPPVRRGLLGLADPAGLGLAFGRHRLPTRSCIRSRRWTASRRRWTGSASTSRASRDELEGKRHLLQDFVFLRDFSYGCKQVFSADRWALTGEAGVFLDPFYSPGSDFIAIANTYITELIARDRAGRADRRRARASTSRSTSRSTRARWRSTRTSTRCSATRR